MVDNVEWVTGMVERIGARVPKWLLILGGLCIPGTAAFMARIVWEETVLTAARGPQMVGFSLMHGALGGIVVPMLLSNFGLHLWLLVMVVVFGYNLLRRRRLPPAAVVLVALALAVAAPLYVPYGWWRYLVLRSSRPVANAAEHLTYAAALGEMYNVKELLRQGIAVDGPGSSDNTALASACVGGNLDMVKFLVEQGADVNRPVSLLRRTPLMNAIEMGHPQVVEFLLTVGADASASDNEGKTVLEIAREKGDATVVAAIQRAAHR